MRPIRYAAIALASLLAVQSATPAWAKTGPVDYAAIVAAPQRNADNRALDEARAPAAVLAFSGIKPGDTVADYSAGGGYYSELIADLVGPKGRVLALGSPRFYKADVWDKLTALHPNIVPIVSTNFDLAPRSVDVIFTHLVFHDLFVRPKPGEAGVDASRVIANWYAAVKPGGYVIVADHRASAGDVAEIAGTLHRIDPEIAKSAMLDAGFVLDDESDVLHRSDDSGELRVFDPQIRGKTDRFLLRFRRP
ncbi:MAG: class I SAM-dependent methyltransferase [Sphingomonadales bacterium]|nr:class I SAM-dependent methyltransferase [Sphingomonadales bacterium]MBU3991507.1 methyltransferase [Alphaproteobacteria bacterium]